MRASSRRDPTAKRRARKKHAPSDQVSSDHAATTASAGPAVAAEPSFARSLSAEMAAAEKIDLGTQAAVAALEREQLRGELRLSESLLSLCDGALAAQDAMLVAAQQQLAESDAVAEECREARLRAEQQAAESAMLASHAAERQAEVEGDLAAAEAEAKRQSEAFRAGVLKMCAAREDEASAFAEKARVWERTIEQWLHDGFSKRIDPILHSTNRPVFERLHELLAAERAGREQQLQILQAASRAEMDAQREAHDARLAAAERSRVELASRRADFDESLRGALTSPPYLPISPHIPPYRGGPTLTSRSAVR